MEINRMFGSGTQSQKKNEKESQGRFQFGVQAACACADLSVQPLLYGLQKGLVPHDFTLKISDPRSCAHHLIQGQVELALIPSIEYAKGKGAWQIVPQICLAAQGALGSMALFFNKDLHTLRRIAVDERFPSALALLQIILREKYEIESELIPVSADLPTMLTRADAALLCGDRALNAQADFPAHLDLGEEWYDLTGLPFVAAFWAGHEISLSENEAHILQQSAEIGLRNIEKISKEFAAAHPQDFAFYQSYLNDRLRYTFGKSEIEGLKEFFNYAFYLGLIEHIPDLHFLGQEETK